MASHGWNSNFPNVNRYSHSREYPRPYGSTSTMLACRICDKIYLSTHSLIEHYQTHDDEEIANQRQDQHHQRNSILRYQGLGERRDLNAVNQNNPFQSRVAPSSSAMPQRHHPYFPNGYRTMQQQGQQAQQARERNLVPVANTNSSFLVPTQNPLVYQPRNFPVAENGFLSGSSPHPFSTTGWASAASAGQSPMNQPAQVLQPSTRSKPWSVGEANPGDHRLGDP